MTLILALVVLAGMRVGELLLSRHFASSHPRAHRPPDPIYPWMVALHSSLFLLLPFEKFWGTPLHCPTLAYLVGAVFAAATALRVWTLSTLGRSWNVRVLAGADYPIVLVGPYRWIRHPNYLTVILELASFPLLWGLWGSALFLGLANAWVLYHRIRAEESSLMQNPVWSRAMANKPRFVPRLNQFLNS